MRLRGNAMHIFMGTGGEPGTGKRQWDSAAEPVQLQVPRTGEAEAEPKPRVLVCLCEN